MAAKGFVYNHLQNVIVAELRCQFDPPCGVLLCSWFSQGCVARAEELTAALLEGNTNAFRAVYHEILDDSAKLRRCTNPELRHVQTLFYPEMILQRKVVPISWSHHELNSGMTDTFNEYVMEPCTNAAEVKETKKGFPMQSFEDLALGLKTLFEKKYCFVAHRHGQAFAALPLDAEGSFVVLDSHVRHSTITDVAGVVAWVKKMDFTDEGRGCQKPLDTAAYSLLYWGVMGRK